MIPFTRHLQRRQFGKLFTMKIPMPDMQSEADDVWGFMSKAKASELVKSHRMLAAMVQKSYVGPVKQQLEPRGFEQEEFQRGCKVAYQRIADIYKLGEPVFKEKHMDIVEEQVAEEIDEQLKRFKSKSLKPRLITETVDARLLFMIRARKESFEGPFWTRLFNAIVSLSVQNFQPKYELLAAVEFKVWEKFDLLPIDGSTFTTSTTSPTSTASDATKISDDQAKPETSNSASENKPDGQPKAEKSEDTAADSAKDDDDVDDSVGSRRHFFVFAADLPAGEIPQATEADVVEFKVRSIGRAFGM